MKTYTQQVSNCSECPHWDHSGGFTQGGSIPLCRAGNKRRELPFAWVGGTVDQATGQRHGQKRQHANVIPMWCPL